MLISTPGFVLHTTPYGETSVIVKVFTRLLGVRSYIVKGGRGRSTHIKQNLLQPLSCLDLVVYDNPKTELNHVKELSLHAPAPSSDPVGNALRFFMTEVLYKSLQEAEPMPALFDYVESVQQCQDAALPINFMLTVAHHLGIEPLDNYSSREPLFDLQEGRYSSTASETTLSPNLSDMLHDYLTSSQPTYSLALRRALIDALLAYYHLHLASFRNFTSHEILHTILK